MRSLIATLTFIFAIACTSGSAHKEGCPCSNLGTGSNPCRCDEIVVKAAKQCKPLRYVSPEAIAEAAVTREIISKFSAKQARTGSCGINYVETAAINGNPTLYEIVRQGALVAPSSGTETSGRYGCGGDASKVQVGIRDLLNPSPNARIVPKFPPIGDMCHASSGRHPSGSVTLPKVTPAYPGKVKCTCNGNNNNNEHAVDCMSVLSSLINNRGLGSVTEVVASNGASAAQGSALRTGSATIALNELANGYGSFSESFIAQQGSNGAASGFSSANSLGVFGERIAANRMSGSSAAVPYGNAGTVVLVTEEVAAPGFVAADTVSNNAAIVEVTETREQQIIPQAPADPVSLSLAYKNLIPQQRKFIVSEDKLSFGPTAVPKEAVKQAPTEQIDEEKLVAIEKPVMLLQLQSASEKSTVKTSSEEEEERLAELDTLERMRLEKESTIDCAPTPTSQSYVTYRELGYTPVVREYASTAMINVVANVDSSSGNVAAEEPCGPMGPPKPDYIPGNVYVDQSAVETEIVEESAYQNYGADESSIEIADDDEEMSVVDDSQPGFLARLSSASQNYGASVCPF